MIKLYQLSRLSLNFQDNLKAMLMDYACVTTPHLALVEAFSNRNVISKFVASLQLKGRQTTYSAFTRILVVQKSTQNKSHIIK